MRWKKLAPHLFFFLLLSVICAAEDTGTVVHFDILIPEVVLTDFNVTPVSMNQGQTADFSLAMQNIGLASTQVNATVYIYNSLGALVSNFTYDPVPVEPGGTVIVVKTWDSDSLPAGLYTAYANATYSDNYTNTLNVSFAISTIPPLPGPTPSGPSGGSGGGKPKPQPVPPSIVPVGENVRFASVPALKEILAGEGELDSFTLINTADENVSVELRVSGIPEDWMELSQNVSVVFTNQTSVVNFALTVPEDALSGNYLVTIEAEGYGYYAKDYMLLRVKNYPKWHGFPIYLKTIRTDVVQGRTDVSIRLKNPSENNIKLMTVRETIPQSLRGSGVSVEFNDKRGSMTNIGGSEVIMWNVSDFGPLEEMIISYSLNKYLGDYHDYGAWHLRQIDFGGRYDIASLIRVVDLSSQTLAPGGSGDVTATILYAGEEPIEVTTALELPAGFSSDPGYASVLLIPRGLTNVNFRITAPKDVKQTHLIRAVVMGKDFNVFSSAPILVKKGEAGSGVPIIIGGGQTIPGTATISLPWLDIAGAVIAVALALVALFVVVSIARSVVSGAGQAAGRPAYDFDRVKDMGTIRGIINRSIKELGK